MQGEDRYIFIEAFELSELLTKINQMTHVPVTDEGYRYPEGKATHNLVSVFPQYGGLRAILEVL